MKTKYIIGIISLMALILFSGCNKNKNLTNKEIILQEHLEEVQYNINHPSNVSMIQIDNNTFVIKNNNGQYIHECDFNDNCKTIPKATYKLCEETNYGYVCEN